MARTRVVVCGVAAVAACALASCAGVADEGSAAVPSVAPVGAAPALVESSTDPVELVNDCALYVPLAAMHGDVSMQALWREVGEDPLAMQQRCSEMLAVDPSGVSSMSRQLVALTPTTTVAPAPETFPPATPGTWPAYIPRFGESELD